MFQCINNNDFVVCVYEDVIYVLLLYTYNVKFMHAKLRSQNDQVAVYLSNQLLSEQWNFLNIQLLLFSPVLFVKIFATITV